MNSSPDTVVVVGTGTAGAAPDTLVLDLQLEGQGATVSEALGSLTRASHACHEALPHLSVRTHGLGVHRRHTPSGAQSGHTAYQSLQVRTPDPAGAGDLVQRLSEVVGDALSVNGLRPELSDTAELRTRARELAFADARASAQEYAVLAGRELGPVLTVREVPEGGAQPLQRAEARMAMDPGPVVDAADHEVTVAVQVTWQLRG
jgi:hypothetical protein